MSERVHERVGIVCITFIFTCFTLFNDDESISNCAIIVYLLNQQVNTGSIADKAGLQAGDAIVRINSTDLYNLRHKDAQDAIVKSGASFELVVQRLVVQSNIIKCSYLKNSIILLNSGGATWKPTVTPIGSAAPSPATLGGHITPVTKTSLAATKQQVSAIGTGHNTAAKPFVNVNFFFF